MFLRDDLVNEILSGVNLTNEYGIAHVDAAQEEFPDASFLIALDLGLIQKLQRLSQSLPAGIQDIAFRAQYLPGVKVILGWEMDSPYDHRFMKAGQEAVDETFYATMASTPVFEVNVKISVSTYGVSFTAPTTGKDCEIVLSRNDLAVLYPSKKRQELKL